jgi:hypothetical protein
LWVAYWGWNGVTRQGNSFEATNLERGVFLKKKRKNENEKMKK